MSDCTIVRSDHYGSIRITFISYNSTPQKTCNRKYTWLPFTLLPLSGYPIRGTENWYRIDNQNQSFQYSYQFKVIESLHHYLLYNGSMLPGYCNIAFVYNNLKPLVWTSNLAWGVLTSEMSIFGLYYGTCASYLTIWTFIMWQIIG